MSFTFHRKETGMHFQIKHISECNVFLIHHTISKLSNHSYLSVLWTLISMHQIIIILIITAALILYGIVWLKLFFYTFYTLLYRSDEVWVRFIK